MVIGNNYVTLIGLFTACGLMILALLATCPAVKAYEKGRSFVKWYIFGILFLPAAFVASFVIKAHGQDK